MQSKASFPSLLPSFPRNRADGRSRRKNQQLCLSQPPALALTAAAGLILFFGTGGVGASLERPGSRCRDQLLAPEEPVCSVVH